MFYHVIVGLTGLTNWAETNKTKDEVLLDYICPFTRGEKTISSGLIFNMSSIGYLRVYQTDKPIDSSWPLKKSTYKKDELDYKYKEDLLNKLKQIGTDVSKELFKEAVFLIKTGKYIELQNRLEQERAERYSFFICPFQSKDVDDNYEFVIKPEIEKLQYEVQRVEEIAHTGLITEEILKSIAKSSFIIADLTEEKQNCYYELGYAHALSKPTIILAKNDTKRHFDIAGFKWVYWRDFRDLKTKFKKELSAVIKRVEEKNKLVRLSVENITK